jgi:hypothetical protein
MANKIYEEYREFLEEAGFTEHLFREDGPWSIPHGGHYHFPMDPGSFQQLMLVPLEDLPRLLLEIEKDPRKYSLRVPNWRYKDTLGSSKGYSEPFYGFAYNAALTVLRKRLELGK